MLRLSPDLTLPVDAVTGTFGILATKGAGKSNAAVVFAEEMYDAGVPWVAIDPKGDWWGIRSSSDGKGPGLPIVVFGGRHGDVPLEPTAGALLADLVLTQRLSCVLDVSQFTKADVIRFLLAFGAHLFRHADDDQVEPIHLFLEEAHEYLPQQVSSRIDGGDIGKLVNVWQRIVKQGRFKGLGVTMISQRSSVLNKDVLELIDTLIVLRTMGPKSRESIKKWVEGQDVDEKLLASLPTLVSGEAWIWSPGELDIMKRIQFRRRRTFDSGATPKVGQTRRTPATLADVDLAAIKEQMAETIEKAKADDPKELRRQITELQRTVTRLENERPEPVVEPVEVPVLTEEQIVGLGDIVERAHELRAEVDVWQVALSNAVHDITESLDRFQNRPVVSSPPGSRWKAPTPPADHQQTGEKSRRAPAPRRTADHQADTDLPVGEHRVLTAIAQHRDGVVAEQLTVLTGYKRSSRNTYVQRLRSRGYVDTTGGRIVATDNGVAALGDFEPLPTGAALQDYWLERLPEGEWRILTILLQARGDDVQFETLDEATGYKRSSRNTYLQRLRARQLVTTDTGTARAAGLLFEEAR